MADNMHDGAANAPEEEPVAQPSGIDALFMETPPTVAPVAPPETADFGSTTLADEAAAMAPEEESAPTPPEGSSISPAPEGEASTTAPAIPGEEPTSQPKEITPPVEGDIAVPPGGETAPTEPPIPGGEIDLTPTEPVVPTAGYGGETTGGEITGTEESGGTVTPVPEVRAIMPPGSVVTTPPGPDDKTEIVIPTPSPLTPEERQKLLDSLGPDAVSSLRVKIKELTGSVTQELSSRPNLARHALDALRQGQEILFATPERLADSEYIVNQVGILVNNVKQSKRAGRYYGPRLLAYEMAWFVALVTIFTADVIWAENIRSWLASWWVGGVAAAGSMFLLPLLNTSLWGGIGGVVGAMYSLWWHVSDQQDFNPQHNLWYLTQPIMGFILGAVVYLIIGSGFLAVQGSMPTVGNDVMQYFPALVAALGGFRQKFAYELFDRLMQAITPPGK